LSGVVASAGFTVRSARDEDAEAIRAIYNEAVANLTATMDVEPRTAQEQAVWMALHDGNPYPAFVAEDTSGNIAGYASLSPYNRKPGYRTTAEVSVYIHCDCRGRGIGRLLLEKLIDEAAAHGFYALVALITAENAASLHLHERCGFEYIGTLRRVGRKFDRWVDVTFMQRFVPHPLAEKET
jgi:L-amino acid N-acyltransferase